MLLLLFIQSLLLSFNSDPTGRSDKDLYFINNNPATINNNLSFGYIPNKFNLSELNEIYLATIYKINEIYLSARINSLNNDLNNNTNFSLGTIYKYNELFNIGINFNYNNYIIKNYINENSFSINLGAIFYFDSIFSVGAYYNNIPLNSSIYDNNDYFKTAISYSKDKFSVFIGADVLFNINSGIVSGIKYDFNKYLTLRVDYSSLINSINTSLSLKYNNIYINLFLSHHNSLGYSQNYQINYDY